MSSSTRYRIIKVHRDKLNQLPCCFTVHDARAVGLPLGELQKLKERGAVQHKSIKRVGYWIKSEC